MSEKKRGERRDRSRRYGARARRVHLQMLHPDSALDCICEQSVWFFRKRKSVGCSCRAKQKGAPKIVGGMCGGVGYRPVVEERIRGRRLARGWLSCWGAVAPDDIEL